MKFTGGYLLGAATVIGFGVSFLAGAVAMDLINTKKIEVAQSTSQRVSDTTVSSMIFDFLNTKNRKN